MLFELKFDLNETKKKNPGIKDSEIVKLAYNTYCVKFVDTMRKNGFNLKQYKDDKGLYFGMEIPKGIEKKTRPIIPKQNKKPVSTNKKAGGK